LVYIHARRMLRLLASSLGVVCPTCDVLGPPGSLRCEACGTPFVQWLPAARPQASPAEAPPPSMPQAVTPAVLALVEELSAGRSVEVNQRLIADNAALAAEVAVAYAGMLADTGA